MPVGENQISECSKMDIFKDYYFLFHGYELVVKYKAILVVGQPGRVDLDFVSPRLLMELPTYCLLLNAEFTEPDCQTARVTLYI